ncbi:hypothetical protein [Erythrobacter sp.]|uniref:hypothetical protein n=1 Tax=Erythrobacter sp. TaxID=1042 RepID=UPI003C70E306
MSDTQALWHATFRKEAMDMMAALWRDLDDAGRAQLSETILAGPPDAMLEHVDDEERPTSRDRRIYDRIVVLERVQDSPLTPSLQQRMVELRAAYPHWRAADGERAHFGSWMEMRWGPDTRYSVDDLSAMADEALIEALRNDMDRREGLLDAWRQLVIAQPKRGFDLLEQLGRSVDPGPADAWEYGLWGLRDADNAGPITDRMVKLLTEVPEALFSKSDVVRGAADLLEAKSRSLRDGPEPDGFWALFDRAVRATGTEPLDEEHRDENNQRDWVSEAINRSLGRIATAFVNALFARRPGVGVGLPDDLTQRATDLMSPDKPSHRLARTIGASRISYLYAIDPDWTTKTLLPSFGWTDEEESIAMWQAYAWQARIDPQLWGALKADFLPLFRPDRLARIGSWGRNIAQSLMLVGVAFGADELKRDEVRDAIRSMPQEMREDAASWIAGYMEAGDDDNDDEEEEPIEGSPDLRWTRRIWPWLKRVWPTEASLRSAGVAEQFALAAIATDTVFPEAVGNIASYAIPTNSYRLIQQLNGSNHPDDHPEATLKLLDAFVARDQLVMFEDDLHQVVQRLGATHVIQEDNRYRSWATHVAQRQH